MTFEEIRSEIDKMQSDDQPIDYGSWIDKGVEKIEEMMKRQAYETVIAEATSMTLIYKLNHKRAMGTKQKRFMVIELMKKHGLIEQ